MGNVTSLHGEPTGLPEPNEYCIEMLECLLEKARSGVVIGVAVAALNHKGVAETHLSGMVGGYSLLGALACVHAEVLEIARAEC